MKKYKQDVNAEDLKGFHMSIYNFDTFKKPVYDKDHEDRLWRTRIICRCLPIGNCITAHPLIKAILALMFLLKHLGDTLLSYVVDIPKNRSYWDDTEQKLMWLDVICVTFTQLCSNFLIWKLHDSNT